MLQPKNQIVLGWNGIMCLLMLAFSTSCSEEDSIRRGTFTDERDGREYQWIDIDGIDWMAEDLELDGQMEYHFYEALDACPEGWQLPTLAEWIDLANVAGGYLFYGDQAGDPEQAFGELGDARRFNGTVGATYWTATPAWTAEFLEESEAVQLLPSGTGNGGTLSFDGRNKNDLTKCRCLRREGTPIGALHTATDQGLFQFVDFATTHVTEDGIIYLHVFNLTGNNDFEWVQFTVDVEGLIPGSSAGAIIKGTFQYFQANMVNNGVTIFTNQDLEVIVFSYEEDFIEGAFADTVRTSGGASVVIEQGVFEAAY